jgi:hypothetical protein
MVEIKIPISVGELIDKITILQIKSQHTDSEFVKKELNNLREISKQIDYNKNLEEELYVINRKLWNVEDALRLKEKEQDFGLFFTELARDVYFLNDKRAEVKRKINEETGSLYKEIKCY